MKKIILLAALLLAASIQLSAIPAYRGLIPYTQPDGSVIQIRLHGDEFFHWTTDVSGNVIEQGEDGYYHPVPAYVHQIRRSEGARRRTAANAARASRIGKTGIAHGQKHFLVILVEFSDVQFSSSTANEDFTKLLNQAGYSDNGATGSARDYYYDNSHHDFEPIFDVYGPVKLANNQKYYGGNTSSTQQGSDRQPELAVKEGCEALAPDIDFSKYDNDGDGDVDLVFMYYAGKGEADGGGTDCIWPHQWELSNGGINLVLGGKKIDRYACSNEIVNHGALSGKMCGIGTACHEFGHAMGLPDFYDTDYETNGEASGLYDFSLMCGGSYNNNGRTPPYLNIEERIMLGWVEPSAIQEISSSGQYSVPDVDNNIAYKASTNTDGEYFIFETRGGQGWDKYIPTGLLIYHVDKSNRKVTIVDGAGRSVNVPAADLWNYWASYNAINENGSHPCFYIIPANNPTALYQRSYNLSTIVFPGSSNVTSYQPIDWNGEETPVSITGIQYTSSTRQVSFNASVMNKKGVSGYVTDTSGNPLGGVTIQLDPLEGSTSSVRGKASIRVVKANEAAQYSVQTDSNGYYEIDLQECTASQVELSAHKDGYVSSAQTVTLKVTGNKVNFTLMKVGETVPTDLCKYDTDAANFTSIGIPGYDLMASVCFTHSELSMYTGDLIKSITFYPYCTSATIYVIIDFGGTRALTYKVTNPQFGDLITVPLENLDLHIPESGDVYFGYGVQGADYDYPLVCTPSKTFHGSYFDYLNLGTSDWTPIQNGEDYYDIAVSVTVKKEGEDPGPEIEPGEDPIAAFGFSYIEIPESISMTAGTELPLKVVYGKGLTPRITAWYLDGAAVSADSITLTGGTHTLRAVIYYENSNTTESIEVELEVQ
jgi:M6 family metalloprotease-like protein